MHVPQAKASLHHDPGDANLTVEDELWTTVGNLSSEHLMKQLQWYATTRFQSVMELCITCPEKATNILLNVRYADMYILALTSPDELSSSTSNTSIKCAYCRFLIIHISLTEGSIPLLMLNGTGAVINTKAHAHGCAKLRNDPVTFTCTVVEEVLFLNGWKQIEGKWTQVRMKYKTSDSRRTHCCNLCFMMIG